MRRTKQIYNTPCIVFLLIIIIFLSPFSLYAETAPSRIPEEATIEITKEFYESLMSELRRGEKHYSNDPSNEFLKEISISTRFMVETNLQIIKQQERILQFLRSLLEDKKK